jgi:glycine cleavage system aminomethyltransferase T
LDDLKKDVYGNDIGWIAAYNICKEYCPEHDEDPLMTEAEKEEQDAVEDMEDEFEEEEENDEMEGVRQEDWQVMAAQGPRARRIISRLGMRDLD